MKLLSTLFFSLALLLAGCSQPKQFISTDLSMVEWGKDFALTDHNGQPRRLGDFKGKVVVLFFGYTQCPDVCPTALSGMSAVMEELGPEGDRVQVIFVTVDPERDTQELLAAYVPSFNPSFLGLRGDQAAIDKIAQDFKIIHQIEPGKTPDSYTVGHTASSLVFDPAGRLRLFLTYAAEPEKVAADIKLLLKGTT